MKKKIGEVFTVTRETYAGTGYSYYLAGLSGGLAFVGFSQTAKKESKVGGIVSQEFTFICLNGGKASFQLAKFRVFDTSDILYENVIPVDIEEKSQANSSGGWTDYRKVGSEEEAIFEEAFKEFVGVKYTPLLVKSQIVSGVNYSYTADAVGVYPGAKPYKVQVLIYKPISGKAVICNIVQIDENALK